MVENSLVAHVLLDFRDNAPAQALSDLAQKCWECLGGKFLSSMQ